VQPLTCPDREPIVCGADLSGTRAAPMASGRDPLSPDRVRPV